MEDDVLTDAPIDADVRTHWIGWRVPTDRSDGLERAISACRIARMAQYVGQCSAARIVDWSVLMLDLIVQTLDRMALTCAACRGCRIAQFRVFRG